MSKLYAHNLKIIAVLQFFFLYLHVKRYPTAALARKAESILPRNHLQAQNNTVRANNDIKDDGVMDNTAYHVSVSTVYAN